MQHFLLFCPLQIVKKARLKSHFPIPNHHMKYKMGFVQVESMRIKVVTIMGK